MYFFVVLIREWISWVITGIARMIAVVADGANSLINLGKRRRSISFMRFGAAINAFNCQNFKGDSDGATSVPPTIEIGRINVVGRRTRLGFEIACTDNNSIALLPLFYITFDDYMILPCFRIFNQRSPRVTAIKTVNINYLKRNFGISSEEKFEF